MTEILLDFPRPELLRHWTEVSETHSDASQPVPEGPMRVASDLPDESPNPNPDTVIELDPVAGVLVGRVVDDAIES